MLDERTNSVIAEFVAESLRIVVFADGQREQVAMSSTRSTRFPIRELAVWSDSHNRLVHTILSKPCWSINCPARRHALVVYAADVFRNTDTNRVLRQ